MYFNYLCGGCISVSYLFSNTTYAINRMKKFNYEKQQNYSFDDVEKIYSKWETYFGKTDDIYRWQPNPTNSGMALLIHRKFKKSD